MLRDLKKLNMNFIIHEHSVECAASVQFSEFLIHGQTNKCCPEACCQFLHIFGYVPDTRRKLVQDISQVSWARVELYVRIKRYIHSSEITFKNIFFVGWRAPLGLPLWVASILFLQ